MDNVTEQTTKRNIAQRLEGPSQKIERFFYKSIETDVGSKLRRVSDKGFRGTIKRLLKVLV